MGDFTLTPYRAELRNEGKWGRVRPYTARQFVDLARKIKLDLDQYNPVTAVDVQLMMPSGTLDKLLSVDAFADEKLALGSKVGWRSHDRSLKAILYVGREEDFKVNPEDKFIGKAKRIAPTFLTYMGWYGMSAATGQLLKTQANAPNVGEFIARAGKAYGVAKTGLRVYDELTITGFSTLKLMPEEGSSPSMEQVNIYRSLVERYGGR
jgi:hypothetical protein